MKNTILIALIGVSLFTTAHSQNIFNSPPNYLSLNIGHSVMDDLLPESVDYSPTIFLASVPIWWKGRWSVYSEIQFAQAFKGYKPQSDWEFGLNFGFMYQQPLFRTLKLTIALGTGPHYITLNTSRQDHGFIFSDNFELGLVYPISKSGIDFNLKVRYRHISNAGLQAPNVGIDNLFFVMGITKHFF